MGRFPDSELGFLSTVNDIELTVQISRPVLQFSRAFQQIFIPQSAFVDADFSDNQTDILPLELESKRDCNIESVFLDVGKTDRISTMVYLPYLKDETVQ